MDNVKILIIEDNQDMAFTLTKILKKEGYDVIAASTGKEGIGLFQESLYDLVLLDLNLPDMNGIEVLTRLREMNPDILIIMITATTDVTPAIEAMKCGAYDYLIKPFELDELKIVVKKALETHEMKREIARFRREHKDKHPNNELFGESKPMQEIRNLIKIVAETPRTSVLIQGESGTGKELVANAIHYSSERAGQSFIKLNCSAIPDNLLESELFGHEKGAFTDAKGMKKGLFELANGGTIFLDEISSMKLSLQPKILRVIESQTFRRIGGVSDIKIDVRVIAATNTDLAEQVKLKEFRDDLYYRLKVMEINILPLKERRDDILLLAKMFLQEYNKEFNRNVQKFAPETEKLLVAYHWPGNVRELRNVVERGVILCQDPVLHKEHLPIELKDSPESASIANMSLGDMSLQEMERLHIQEVLKAVEGNKSQAARVLQISRSTLREKLKSFDVE